MQVDQRVECFDLGPEWMQRRVVEILAIGVTVDHGAAEFQLVHAAIELVGGRLGVLHRQMREAGILVGPLLDFPSQKIVALARLADRGRGVALDLHARSAQRQDRPLDPAAVHRLQPLLAEIIEAGDHTADDMGVHIADGGLPVILEAWAQEVLFERDLLGHLS